jgi:hypothetical protein
MSPRMRPRGQAKRHPLNMRTTEAIRRRLEEAAEVSGRSLAQEVERRLEESFTQEELRAENARLFDLIEKQFEQLKRRDELLENVFDVIEAMKTSPLVRAAMGAFPDFTKPAQEKGEDEK